MYTDKQILDVKKEIAELEAVPVIDFNAHLLPKRTADTMSDVISMTSPDGKVSNATKERSSKRLGKALFGNWTPDIRHPDKIANRLRDLHYALLLMGMVNRGSGKRKYPKIINPIIKGGSKI